mmetsp:Transcript_15949/g.35297  ORF Transcript_15949/g.35297 Transcript_15949/m.35297 type:complete len:326 (+) Transcript_15949:133-1110(+)
MTTSHPSQTPMAPTSQTLPPPSRTPPTPTPTPTPTLTPTCRSITSKTKVLLLNSPHNPTGKVFTLAELEAIAEIVREHPGLTVVSDEVYKFTVYDPREKGDLTSTGHYHFARLPEMWDQTVTISSAGKTFSVTGWQVGWMVGPERYIAPVHDLLPCVQFCAATPVQEALCGAMVTAEQPYEGYSTYYEWLRSQFSSKRAILEEGLVAAGMQPISSTGGFFLMAQLPEDQVLMRELQRELAQAGAGDFVEPYDWRYCRKLAAEHNVIAIPASPFFSRPDYSQHYSLPPLARFAFCKRDVTLDEAKRRLMLPPASLSTLSPSQKVSA